MALIQYMCYHPHPQLHPIHNLTHPPTNPSTQHPGPHPPLSENKVGVAVCTGVVCQTPALKDEVPQRRATSLLRGIVIYARQHKVAEVACNRPGGETDGWRWLSVHPNSALEFTQHTKNNADGGGSGGGATGRNAASSNRSNASASNKPSVPLIPPTSM